MEQKEQEPAQPCFRFLRAGNCSAELLASVYGDADRKRQLRRIRSLLDNESASRCYFGVAEHKDKIIALLQLCQDKQNPRRFRIRGLYCSGRFRRQGLASRLLQLAGQNVFERHQGEEIVSFILPTNFPSITAHERAGFSRCAGLQAIMPERHLCFVLQRKS